MGIPEDAKFSVCMSIYREYIWYIALQLYQTLREEIFLKLIVNNLNVL